MADAATGVSENLMDSEATNGSSDSNTSGSALLSRKGLFGKSGLLNQNLETTIATEKEVHKPEEEKSNGDGNDGANTSGSGTDQLEVASNEDTTEEDERQTDSAPQKTTNEEQVNYSEPAEDSKDGESIDTSQTDTDSSTAGQLANNNEHESDNKDSAPENGEQKDESIDKNVDTETDEKDETDDTYNAADEAVDDRVVGEKEHDVPIAEGSEAGDSAKDVVEEKPEPGEEEANKDKEPEAVVEEVCVKRIISMDTDDVNENEVEASTPLNEHEKEEPEVRMEITEITIEESYREICEETTPIVEEPEGAESECMEEREHEADERKSEQEAVIVVAESETVVVESVTGTIVTDKKEVEEEKKEEHEQEQDEEKEDEEVPKRRASSRRAAVAASPEKKTPVRGTTTPAKKTPARKRADEEKADDEEKPDEADHSESKDAEEKEEPIVGPKSLRSRGRRSNVAETPKAEEKTAVKKRGKTPKSAKKDVAAEAEDESEQDANKEKEKTDDMDSEPTRCSLRSRAAKSPNKQETPAPKSATRRGRSVKKDDGSVVKKETEVDGRAEPETPRRGRKAVSTPATTTPAAKTSKITKGASVKKTKEEDHDPYDIDTEIERHPEPLKNIQMEVQSFGEVKYAKMGSGKYEHTEKTAESRVVNLAELAPRTKQRKSLADLTPGRKKASPTASGSRTAPHPARGRKGKLESDEADKEEEPMEVEEAIDVQSPAKKAKKTAETPKSGGSARKRRGSPQTTVASKRAHVEVPQLSAEDLLAVDNPQDDHAAHEAGARVYAMFDGLFYPAVVVSRDGLGRYKVSFVEDGVVKDVPSAGVIPLRALDLDKECYYSDASQKDRLAVKVLKAPDSKHAAAWQEALFELEHLDDEGNSTGEKLKGVWTNLALSKDDWRDYINKKSREATDIIADNIESTEDRHTRRSKVSTPIQQATASASKSAPRSQKKEQEASTQATPKNAKGRGRKKAELAEQSASKTDKDDEYASESAPETSDEQIFIGKLFILTSANRPNVDTGFKKKFMTDFISSHGGLVVDDMKEVDEHPEMERFLISDTHYRTHKYLAALVRAMPCVSHEWIYKCLDERKLVDYKGYLLPSGVSILDDREYPLPKERGVLLRNKRVMVHSNVIPPSKKSMSFEQIWVPMVPQLGGEIVTEMPNEEGKLDILLTDHSATTSLVEKARKIGAVVVSSEWLIQGIIMDRLPDVNAHQKFLHNGGVCT